jgi:SPP1 gp7 family putative phage head morphogenesis protein
MSTQAAIRKALEDLKAQAVDLGDATADVVDQAIVTAIKSAVREFATSGQSSAAIRAMEMSIRAELLRSWTGVFMRSHRASFEQTVNVMNRGYLGAIVGLPPSVNVPFDTLLDAAMTLYQPPKLSHVENVLKTAKINGKTAEQYLKRAVTEAGNVGAALRADTKDLPKDAVRTIARVISEGRGPAEVKRALAQLPQTEAYFNRYPGRLTATARTWTAEYHERAKAESLEAIADVIDGTQYSATLDSRTRPDHAILDGNVYSSNPTRGQLPLAQLPRVPLAPNCRCTHIPWLAPEMRLIRQATERASINGPVKGETTYAEWFNSQSADLQRKVIGAQRYDATMAAQGEVRFTDVIHPDGSRLRSVSEITQST